MMSAIGAGSGDQSYASDIVLVGGGILQRLLGGIDYEAPVVVAPHDLDRGERYCHFLLTDAEKTPDPDERGGNRTVGSYDEIVDGPDLLPSAIVHALVEVRAYQHAAV